MAHERKFFNELIMLLTDLIMQKAACCPGSLLMTLRSTLCFSSLKASKSAHALMMTMAPLFLRLSRGATSCQQLHLAAKQASRQLKG